MEHNPIMLTRFQASSTDNARANSRARNFQLTNGFSTFSEADLYRIWVPEWSKKAFDVVASRAWRSVRHTRHIHCSGATAKCSSIDRAVARTMSLRFSHRSISALDAFPFRCIFCSLPARQTTACIAYFYMTTGAWMENEQR